MSSRAAGLLAANALSIEQVALHSGYQSRGSFTRTFRTHYETDPSHYRSEAKRVFVAYQVEEDGVPSDWGHDKNNVQIHTTLDEL
jgi:AraC-like DNA-binding protein